MRLLLYYCVCFFFFFFFQAEDGIRDLTVTGVQTCALPISVAPASLRWIRMNVDEKQRGLAMGIYMAGTKIGPAIGAPIAAFLIAVYGWKAMFYLTGLISLIWLIPWLVLVPRDDAKPAVQAASVRPSGPPFWHLFKTPTIWGIILGTFCYSCYL